MKLCLAQKVAFCNLLRHNRDMSTSETLPPISVKLSGELVRLAKTYASVQDRSVPKQIEYWAKIGRIAMDNPDLPLSFIEGALEGMAQLDHGDTDSFEFQHIKPKHAYRTVTQVQENL
jgi:hypothetical protein